MNKIEDKRKVINELGLDKIKSYFELNKDELSSLDREQLKHLHNMATLGMRFEREINLAKRSTELNYIRIGKVISENKEELKKYIKRTLPQYA